MKKKTSTRKDNSAPVNHYNGFFKGFRIDPYRIETVCGPFHPAQAHAIKKLIRAGKSDNSLLRDINEAIMSLERWKEMLAEDQAEPTSGRKA